ncbi:MAG: hypothetical protein IT438_13420 [Phycisphaerales bacterium]|nr:hypothetical protein [Phycisphaerales bacterium]
MRSLLCLSILSFLVSPALGQTHRLILREGDEVSPGGPLVASITCTTTNGVGGYGVAVNSGASPSIVSHILTTTVGGLVTPPVLPTLLRSEGLLGALTVTAFEGEFGLSDSGSVAYGITANSGAFTGLDGVALDDTVLADERDSADPPFAGQFWSFNSRIRMTPGGVPYWKAGVANSAGGSTANRAVVFGNPPQKLFAGGDTLPNMPAALDPTPSATLFRYRFSADATHSISQDLLDGATSSTDNVMILDGAGMLVDGALVREGSPVPVAAGGRNGENWGNFQEHFINNAGTYYLLGDTSDPVTTQDHYIFANGQMRIREGEIIDGVLLNGAIDEAHMNGSADLAVTWATTGSVELVLLNRRVIFMEGDLIDLDRNGAPTANYAAIGFGATGGIAVSERINNAMVRVYVAADVNPLGTTTTTDDVDALIEITVCLPDINSSGSVTVQDIFDFLSLYFSGDLAADYNNSFSVTVQDIFDFLAGYFAGCSS